MKSIPQFLSLLLILGLLGLFIAPISVAEEGQTETLPVTVGGDTTYASARAEEEWDPFEDMLQMRARFHRMFDDGFWRAMQAPGQVGSSVQRALRQPAMDIAETPSEIILTLDLPMTEF